MNGKGAGRLARLSAIVTILPASMAAGWVIGYFVVDRCLHSFPWGSIIATFAGAGCGFYEIVKILIPAAGAEDESKDGKP
jgi:F0F1-type ATP synthase assembly protein I